MNKTNNVKLKGKYNSSLTEDFRKLVSEKIGKLDTANSFMYLYRRFGEPNFNNKDEYKILYEYRFKHEDLIVTVHASYYEFVYFGLLIPESRLKIYKKKNLEFWKSLYEKYKDGPFAPYAMLPYGGLYGLTAKQNKENWDKIDKAAEEFFSTEDNDYLEAQFKSGKLDTKAYEILKPFEQKMCNDFRKKLTKDERKRLNPSMPNINDIEGLRKQALAIVSEFKKGCYVRDVAINILGYESDANRITKFAD